ncbi:hypothetical protein GCM10010156_34910 [Planobispora rosea]|uniref:Uncharacterized protein n=1 Tax=Planobispora rosea TaxID=35762 RepID=A0A8J3WDP2_PLARO|nr:hypothetical protein [Planobispora rosea]GGS72995.1 hypothetical protein GCM10010156_34910 [Planobispora rosea]GIH85353.1 hypothetical protein Pro02_37610 [Planobispora rosea]
MKTNEGFPGKWIEGTGLVLGPTLVMIGVLLKLGHDAFFPGQLAAFADSPAQMTAAYSCFAAGVVLLAPAVLGVAGRIDATHPRLARWGLALALAGLFARTFHAGVSHLASQLVDVQGLGTAQQAVSGQYGSFHVFQTINLATMVGWIVLAVGAWRAGVLGRVQSSGLALMTAMPLGVLKGSGVMSIVAAAGLCLALVPLGIKVLSQGPAPRWWAYPLAAAIAATGALVGLVG